MQIKIIIANCLFIIYEHTVSKCGMHALWTIIVYLGFPMIQRN